MNQDNLPIFEVELPRGDNRKVKLWFLRREEPKDGREYYSASMTIKEGKTFEENFHCMPDKPTLAQNHKITEGSIFFNNILDEIRDEPPIFLSDTAEFLAKKDLDKPFMENKLGPPKDFFQFQPEKWAVDKNTLRNTIDALQTGLDHTRSTLTEHDSSLGRTTRKNKSWAETIESDIRAIEKSIKDLKLVEAENTTTYK